MRKNLAVLFVAASCAGAFSISASAAESGEHIMVTPEQMKWSDIPSLPPGAKMALIQGPLDQANPFTFRLKFPANYKIPPHWHPAIEHVTVISGTFHLGMGDKFDESKMKALSRGSVAIMQPKTTHFAMTKEATEVQLHGVGPWAITYVNPGDDPRKK
ncbi:cupin domain-containing protein [Noviherbaspirillum sedimenti]|uniref:Cupin n=1 Tax=Noviherbaspirillum sedimenti TaxID=2320865 RepID=A0A3A3GNK2_9BURK|nr:cupin domain-containing protein [Noviherbaspirillum sedimenti]RJG02530.1 cupin [Noviherbaspirillum sedimenti]